MKNYKNIMLFLVSAFSMLGLYAQQTQQISGKIISPYGGKPIRGAIISISGQQSSTISDTLGNFTIVANSPDVQLKIWAQGYYDVVQPTLGRSAIRVVMIPRNKYKYNQNAVIPFAASSSAENTGAKNIHKTNISPGSSSVEEALQSAFPGLNVINKSGMPGEGAYLNLRGIRTLVSNNSPLIVINGVPYLPDMNSSPVIGGYSKSIFNAINLNDIENITLLKGSETALYGSLGSNGVILIETSKATDLETMVEFSGQYGIATHTKELPLLDVDGFKSYIGDIGLTKYSDMGDMLETFPFLKDDPYYYYNFLYNNHTNWQSLIYRPAYVTDNNLRIKGGDAIAKYDLSVGYLKHSGILDKTDMSRYNTRLNGNITLNKRVELFSSIGFAYINSNVQEQGLLNATNPILTALYQAPILSPYKKDEYNHQLPTYDIVRQFNVSNPLAVINTVEMGADLYDLSLNSGINYQLNNQIKLTGLFGLYYNYNRESGFIPGKSSASIVPLEDGVALNSERSGVGQQINTYYNLNGQYTKKLGKHSLNAALGYQAILSKQEYDAGKGRNSSSDFYKTLSYVNSEGRSFYGYINLWNWMNVYGHLDYGFNDLLMASLNVSADGSSSSGPDANRFGAFPSSSITWKAKNMSWFRDVNAINLLNIHAGYGITGNSRFSSNLSKYYYTGQVYRELSGIVRGNVANSNLKWETNHTLDFGIDLSAFSHRVTASVNYYQSLATDVIMPKAISSVYGIDYIYDNSAEISNKGLEASLQLDVIETKNFGFTIGGNISLNKNILENLGAEQQRIVTLSDGSSIISVVGKSPYRFYGFVSDGVFASQSQADDAGLTDYKGNYFDAGDVRFKDLNEDHVIDDKDRTIIGDANPDFFGGIYANLRYKNISLSADFSYSKGNDAYNAVRRSIESMRNFYNQSAAMARRWQTDGQVTDVPRAMYGDPMQNSRFSSRWIEDASYLRLNNLTLSYTLNNQILKFIRGGVVFVSGENLFTLTNYLGLDPVNSFSYDPMMQGIDFAKLALPRTVKFGLKLQF